MLSNLVLVAAVDLANRHMCLQKIKPCMSQYKLLYGETANGSLKQLQCIRWSFTTWTAVVILDLMHVPEADFVEGWCSSDAEPTKVLPGIVAIPNNRTNCMASAGDESFAVFHHPCFLSCHEYLGHDFMHSYNHISKKRHALCKHDVFRFFSCFGYPLHITHLFIVKEFLVPSSLL